jgi:hypothetical protein
MAAMTRYAVIGYEEFPALHLHPIDDGQGVELPAQLYGRWLQARTALDAVHREVVDYLRASGGRGAIPEELWESQDRPSDAERGPHAPWDSS